jgi:hypothetical protein
VRLFIGWFSTFGHLTFSNYYLTVEQRALSLGVITQFITPEEYVDDIIMLAGKAKKKKAVEKEATKLEIISPVQVIPTE